MPQGGTHHCSPSTAQQACSKSGVCMCYSSYRQPSTRQQHSIRLLQRAPGSPGQHWQPGRVLQCAQRMRLGHSRLQSCFRYGKTVVFSARAASAGTLFRVLCHMCTASTDARGEAAMSRCAALHCIRQQQQRQGTSCTSPQCSRTQQVKQQTAAQQLRVAYAGSHCLWAADCNRSARHCILGS